MFILVASVILTFFQLAHSWNNHISVNKENGVDNTSCLQGRIPCATFNMALKGLTHDSTVISIAPGTYTLEQGNETSIGSGLHHIAIIGSNDTIIMCAPLAGLEVLSSYDILFKSIVFKSCGHSFYDGYFYAALCINKCQNVTLLDVSILYSNGTGLFFYQPNGDLRVENSSIIGSTAIHSPVYYSTSIGGIVLSVDDSGKGTLVISKSSIIDHDYEDADTCYEVSGSYKVIIDSCTIVNNSRGFVVNNGLVAFEIFNTNISNWNNSKIMLSRDNFPLNMLNVRMTDTLSILASNNDTMETENISDGYLTWNDNVIITAYFTGIEQYYYSIKLEEWYPTQCYEHNTVSTGKCYSTNGSYTGHCPLSYSNCDQYDNKQICSCEYGRHGPLCGQCIGGYSVAINSPDLICVDDCYSNINGWGLLIAIEFIPLTVMIAIIAVLNVNLNQGSLNAYVFFCQIITINFPSVGYPAWFVTLQGDIYDIIFNYTLLPFRIFNLGFIFDLYYLLAYDYTQLFICLSKSSLGAISFWYVIALYPLLLLALLYSCVIMYDKGWRCVVCVVRPIHRLLARFWRSFNIQPSLTHTIASVYTLCFTQLAATSLKILHPTQYHDEQGKYHARFFYDGSQPYFSGWHGFAGSVAILVLLGLIIITLYLLVYPFKLFQRLFDKLTFKKDFLLSVTDIFTGPYKDGTNGSWDYRYFAGTHFALQLVIMTFYYIPLEKNIPLAIGILEVVVCTLCVCVLVIFRPYKRNIHNFSETLLFLILIVPACYQFSNYIRIVFYNMYVLLLIVSLYSCVWIVKKFYCFCRYRKAYIRPLHVQQQQDNNGTDMVDEQNQYNDEDDILADRLLHPEDYNEHRINQCNEGNNSYGTFYDSSL